MCWTICSLVLLVMLLLYYLGILSTCDAAAVPREALEFTGMSINFRSGKFGYSICPIFSKGHAEFFVNFSMTLLKIGHMGYLRLMHVL